MVFIKNINIYLKEHCEDSSVGEYVNNIDESIQLNNIDKHDRLLITEDDYDKYVSRSI